MAKKGQKSLKGQGETAWGQPKDAQILIQVTRLAKTLFKSKVRSLKFRSAAEFIERFSRGWVEINIRFVDKPSIAGLMVAELSKRGWEVEQMAEECNLPLDKVDALLNYANPTDEDLVWLQMVLRRENDTPYSIDELIKIRGATNGKTGTSDSSRTRDSQPRSQPDAG